MVYTLYDKRIKKICQNYVDQDQPANQKQTFFLKYYNRQLTWN